MNVLLNEFQLEMPEGAHYLPYASGLLASYALKYSPMSNCLKFYFEDCCKRHMGVRAYSVSQWNLNRSILDAIQYPASRIIFGGPSAFDVKDFPVILGEGEKAFSIWLCENWVPLTDPIEDIDNIPSPYSIGLFDKILNPKSQAIIETVRGCPFGCAYCCWGKGSKRVKMHSIPYIQEEAEWIGKNKIEYVFCADGNFGMFPRDIEVAKIYAKVKKKYGYPRRFRVCFGKNAEESIFETATILKEADLIKSVTISRQTTNPPTLQAIGRSNISQVTFNLLQDRYSEVGTSTYSELIFGLPEETYSSFKRSIIESMRCDTQLFIYPLSALPGTRLADFDYQFAHGIHTTKVLLTPVHCCPPEVPEFENIVTSTKTLSIEDWVKGMVLSWLVQLFYSFKLAEGSPEEMVKFCEWMSCMDNLKKMPRWQEWVSMLYEIAYGMLKGEGRCIQEDFWGPCYWEPEEFIFLNLCCFSKGEIWDGLLLNQNFNISFCLDRIPEMHSEEDPKEFAKKALLHARKSNMKRERGKK